MVVSLGTHRCNMGVVAASVVATACIYVARTTSASAAAAANSTANTDYLRWRCPVGTFAAIVFACGQLSGVGAICLTLKKNVASLSFRCSLWCYLIVSAFSAAMLLTVLFWLSGVVSPPRCLSGSAACVALSKNLGHSGGWITGALCGLAGCQVLGTFAASHSLRLCCCCAGPPPDTGAGQDIVPVATVRPHSSPGVALPVGLVVGVAKVGSYTDCPNAAAVVNYTGKPVQMARTADGGTGHPH